MKLYLFILLLILTVIVYPAFADETEWVDPQEKTLRLEESFARDKFLVEATSFFNNSVLITVYWNGTKIDSNVMRINDSWNVSNNVDNNVVNNVSNNVIRINDLWNVVNNVSNNVNNRTVDREKIINITIKDLREEIGNISAQEGLNVIVDQWVRVQIRMAGEPLPMISIVPEEKHFNNRTVVNWVFGPHSEIPINFTIKNNGKATLRDPKLVINTNLSLLFYNDKLHYELPPIKSGDNITVNMRFRAPFIGFFGKRINFTISANVTGRDTFRRKYQDNDTINITARPYYDNRVELTKFTPERIYMGDYIVVSLNVKNNMFGFENRSIILTDSIPIGFEVLDGGNGGTINRDNISWNITLNQSEKTVLYKLRPKSPGIYSLGSVCIYSDYSDYSNNISEVCSDIPNKVSNHKIITSGPYVELIKGAEKNIMGNKVEIKVYIKNKGDRSAIVKLVDYVPKNYILNSSMYSNITSNNSENNDRFDKIYKTMLVRPYDVKILGYTLSVGNADNIYTLPPTRAEVSDQFLYLEDKYVQRIVSNNLTINR